MGMFDDVLGEQKQTTGMFDDVLIEPESNISAKEMYGLPDRERTFADDATDAAATVLGAPVDLATAALNVPLGWINQKIENPALGSEYLKGQLEQERLVTPDTRAKMGVFFSPEEKQKAIREGVGAGNYLSDQKGDITHVRDDKGQMVPYQEGLYDWAGAITESAGPILSTVAAPFSGASTAGRAAIQGAGQAVSSTARHILSSLMGENIPLEQRFKDVATKTVATTGAGYALGKLGDGVDYLTNIRNRTYGKAMESPVASERTQSFQAQGVPSSVAQDTGVPGHVSLEMSAAKSTHGQRVSQDLRNNQVDAIEARTNDIMSNISSKSASPESVTTAISNVHSGAVKSMKGARKSNWEQQWEQINKQAGNKEVVLPKNLIAELEAIKAEQTSPLMGQEAKGIVSEINERLSTAFRTLPPKKVDLQNIDVNNLPAASATTELRGLKSKDVQNIMHDLTRDSFGTGKLLEQGNAGIDKALAGRLRTAFEKDLAEQNSPIIGMINDARSTYGAASQKIKRLGNSVIGKLVNAGDKADIDAVTIAERLNTMRPSQVKALIKTLDVHDPAVTNQVRRYYLETALEKAHKLPSGSVSESRDFVESQFLSALPKGRNFDIVYGGSTSKKDVLDMVNIVNRLQELKHSGTGKSLAQEGRDVAGSATGLVMGNAQSLIFAIRSAADFITPKATARMMMTPEGKAAFLKVRALKPGTMAYFNAMTHLVNKYKELPKEEE